MRKVQFMSPSSLALWESNREEYYIKHLSEIGRPSAPQHPAMGAGSGFDAFVKAFIAESCIRPVPDRLRAEVLYEKQVDKELQPVVRERCEQLYQQYKDSKSLGYLLADILKSPIEPQMEFKVGAEVCGVPLKGYPDLMYATPEGVKVLGDWKVSGAYSKHGVSPKPGYIVCRSVDGDEKSHERFKPMKFGGITINEEFLEQIDMDWADQLAIYAWCTGMEPGDQDFIVRMEQVACRPTSARDLKKGYPHEIKPQFVTHLNRISSGHQWSLVSRLVSAWENIQRGHIFTDRTLQESQEHCEQLDKFLKMPPEIVDVACGGNHNQKSGFKQRSRGTDSTHPFLGDY